MNELEAVIGLECHVQLATRGRRRLLRLDQRGQARGGEQIDPTQVEHDMLGTTVQLGTHTGHQAGRGGSVEFPDHP